MGEINTGVGGEGGGRDTEDPWRERGDIANVTRLTQSFQRARTASNESLCLERWTTELLRQLS